MKKLFELNISNHYISKYTCPVSFIGKKLPNYEHDDLCTFIKDSSIKNNDLIIFDDNSVVSVKEIRKEFHVTKESLKTSEEWYKILG